MAPGVCDRVCHTCDQCCTGDVPLAGRAYRNREGLVVLDGGGVVVLHHSGAAYARFGLQRRLYGRRARLARHPCAPAPPRVPNVSPARIVSACDGREELCDERGGAMAPRRRVHTSDEENGDRHRGPAPSRGAKMEHKRDTGGQGPSQGPGPCGHHGLLARFGACSLQPA